MRPIEYGRWKKRSIFWLIAGMSAVLLLYLPALRGEFFYDDFSFIVTNDALRPLSKVWTRFFSDPDSAAFGFHALWRPLRTLSFAVDYSLWGLNPLGYHLHNVFLHWANGLLVFLLTLRLIKFSSRDSNLNWSASLLSTMLFWLHPVQTESVAWIASRGDLLYAFFFLLALLLYLAATEGKGLRPGVLVFSLLAYCASLLSKESGIVLPLVLLLLDRCLRPEAAWRKRLPVWLFFFAVGGFYLALRTHLLHSVAQREYWGGSLYATMMTMAPVWLEYWRLLLFPSDLHVLHTIAIRHSVMNPRVIGGLLFLLLNGFLFWRLRKNGLGFFVLGWFWILMLPVSNLVPFGGLLVEHLVYLSGLTWHWAVGMGLVWILITAQERQRAWHAAGILCVALLLTGYGVGTFARNEVWAQPVLMWELETTYSPASHKAYHELGVALLVRGRYAQARRAFMQALSLEPGSTHTLYLLGQVETCLGNSEIARGYFEQVLEFEPLHSAARKAL
ncbi:MAG: tetratricopeptide repeat protein [Candidatus Omnitrophica bacterium]|nr:tetratricopeptide repeat protein [Candidatus Omnitrophota bacterium]